MKFKSKIFKDAKMKSRNFQRCPLISDETPQYRRLAGPLIWASSQARPGRSFSECEVSVSVKDVKIEDLISANKNKKIKVRAEISKSAINSF